MSSRTFEKVAFVLSLAFISFLYGYASGKGEWFPDAYLSRAADQARALWASRTPAFLDARVYDDSGVTVHESGSMSPGLTLLASTWRDTEGWVQGLRLVDDRGDVVHAWNAEPQRLFPDAAPNHRWAARWGNSIFIHGAYLFDDGDVLVNIEHIGTARLDACGEVVWRLPIRTHHSIDRADDGSFWIPVSGYVERPSSTAFPNGYEGFRGPIYADGIINVSAEGDVLRSIDLMEVLHKNGLERFVLKTHPSTTGDILHLNDVEDLPASLSGSYPLFEAGDLLVSLRNPHLVFVFDPDTQIAKWSTTDGFIEQHDPDFMGAGWIGIFDNNFDGSPRGSVLGGSRILGVQPHTDSVRVVYDGGQDHFYTSLMGKWQALPNGNFLVTEALAGRAFETDRSGSIVWEWIAEPYDAEHVPHLSEATRYQLTGADVARWECSN